MKALLHTEIMHEQTHLHQNKLYIEFDEMYLFNVYFYILWRRPEEIFIPIKKEHNAFQDKMHKASIFFQ